MTSISAESITTPSLVDTCNGDTEKRPTTDVNQAKNTMGRKRARFNATETNRGGKEKIDFTIVETPHPYGVLPSGNRYFDNNRRGINRCPSALLSDEGWYNVLEFCDHVVLGLIVQTCRYFYAAGSEPELWRDLVLRYVNQSKETITAAGPTWKDTLVKLLYHDKKFQPHVPMAVPGVYSDHLYRLHSCRSFTIPQSWSDVKSGNVVRVPYQDMTIDRFEQDFEGKNVPVVIEGAACNWKAFERWQDANYLLDQTKGRSFRATSGAAALPGNFDLRSYLDYCQSSTLEEAPLYLFDRTALTPESPLWKDYMRDLQTTCPYFDPYRPGTAHDLFKVLGDGARPDHTWLIVGPKRSGSVFHIDPNATHAWNVSIVGTKFWIFYPPGVTPPGVHPSTDGDQVTLPLSLGEWLLQFWDEHELRKKFAKPRDRPLECTTRPGDVMFVPHGWWHLVLNLDDLNIAITHNYASYSNLSSVFKFLDTKRDQVSGCRDRPESIKPERLYEELVSALRKAHPDVTERALQRSWACNAWRDLEDVHNKPISKNVQVSSCSVISKAKNGEDSSFSFSFL